MMRTFPFRFTRIICALFAVTVALAQSDTDSPVKPPTKLAEFREAFEKALTSRSAPAREQFSSALEVLMRERADSGNYEGAILANIRRQELLDDANRSAVGTGDDSGREGEIIVDIASGNRSGSGLKYDTKEQKIIGLAKAKQYITWDLNKTVPGTYNAIVTYSCGPAVTDADEVTTLTGGAFTLSESTGLSTSGGAPLERKVQATGGWSKSITRNIGKLKITGSRMSLLLTVTEAEGGGLMHLYGIKLVPDLAARDNRPPPEGQESELKLLRQKFITAIAPTTTPVVIEYEKLLASIHDSLNAADKLTAQRESDAANKLIKAPNLIYRAPETAATGPGKDDEIASLESTYRSEVKGVRQALGEKWLDALSSLKDELTRSQKFPEALLVRSEEQRVEDLLQADPLPSTSPEEVDTIRLDTRLAKLDGGAQLRPEDDSIALLEGGSSASWEVPADLTPGTYELIMRFRSGKLGGGTYRVDVGGDQTLNGTITPTSNSDGNVKRRRSVLVGECILDQLTGTLKISTVENKGGEAILSIQSLVLAPQGTWGEMHSRAGQTPDEEATPDRAQDFEKLSGAKWIDKADRRSGEIAVTHAGKEHTFRLYFVQLPPTTTPASRSGKAELSRAAKQLRTTEDKIIRFGKKVDAALRDALWTESLTIYTRWETRGTEGSPYAFILVGETPLSQSLIEQGHARTGGSFATQVPFLKTKKSVKVYMERLRSAEKEAKQARRGLWGL